jgi:uncharacterized protein (TIGR03437 family)
MLRVARAVVLGTLFWVCPAMLRAATPVVLVNGYQGPSCPPSSSQPASASSFGNLETLLAGNGLSPLFFDNCVACPGCSLEDLGAAFGKFLGGLKSADGAPAPQIDVVAVSMGGLIVRAYLSGATAGGFSPPLETKVRKAVFIGTPHFGSDLLGGLDSGSPQTASMQLGSAFLNNLATWNQGWEDLRGIDALAIAGSGGASSNDDGVVPLSSASLTFTLVDRRTRVIPYCHTEPAKLGGAVACQPGAKTLDNVDDADHLVYRIASSFLTDTADWTKLGTPPSEDPYLSLNGGVYASLRAADDKPVALASVTAAGQTDTKAAYTFASKLPQLFYRESMAAQPYLLTFGGVDGSSRQLPYQVYSGGIAPALFKPAGPYVTGIYGASVVASYSMAPGMFIVIFGDKLASSEASAASGTTATQLADAQVFVNDKTIGLQYANTGEIDAVLPTGLTGLVTLKVVTSQGQHTVNVMVEPAVPSLYYADPSTGDGLAYVFDSNTGKAITTANPAQAGQTISFYGTGLGETTRTAGYDVANAPVTVTIGGIVAQVAYAGRVPDPAFPGVDEIDVVIPAGVTSGANSVYVFAGDRYSNEVVLPVK